MICPLKYLSKQSKFTYQIWANCINDAINKDIFPDNLKIANTIAVHKKYEPVDKENYKAMIASSLLFMVFERLVYGQLSEY